MIYCMLVINAQLFYKHPVPNFDLATPPSKLKTTRHHVKLLCVNVFWFISLIHIYILINTQRYNVMMMGILLSAMRVCVCVSIYYLRLNTDE